MKKFPRLTEVTTLSPFSDWIQPRLQSCHLWGAASGECRRADVSLVGDTIAGKQGEGCHHWAVCVRADLHAQKQTYSVHELKLWPNFLLAVLTFWTKCKPFKHTASVCVLIDIFWDQSYLPMSNKHNFGKFKSNPILEKGKAWWFFSKDPVFCYFSSLRHSYLLSLEYFWFIFSDIITLNSPK